MKAILEMEVPESCQECYMFLEDDITCKADEGLSFFRAGHRHPDCPLKIIEEIADD